MKLKAMMIVMATLSAASSTVAQQPAGPGILSKSPYALSGEPAARNADANTHKSYRLQWKLVRVGPKGKEEIEIPALVVSQAPHTRLVRQGGVWTLDRSKEQDVATAELALDVKVSDRPANKVRINLSVRENNVQKALRHDTLVAGNTLLAIKTVEIGKTTTLVYAQDDRGNPQRWIEVRLSDFFENVHNSSDGGEGTAKVLSVAAWVLWLLGAIS
ncbi:MAG TPA: hypothetical protein VK395_20950 [Gemmataceae bacterium]|nr:hypothetical protein [Gemmataceae bacterium]